MKTYACIHVQQEAGEAQTWTELHMARAFGTPGILSRPRSGSLPVARPLLSLGCRSGLLIACGAMHDTRIIFKPQCPATLHAFAR